MALMDLGVNSNFSNRDDLSNAHENKNTFLKFVEVETYLYTTGNCLQLEL